MASVAAVRPDASARVPETASSAVPGVVLSTPLAGVAAAVRMSQDSLSAREVLGEIGALQARATSGTQRAGLGLARAQALAFLKRDDEACTALRSVRRTAAGTRYQSEIDRLLTYSC